MGAAFDAMCDNEDLQARITKKNRQIREQKKLIAELAEGIVRNLSGHKYADADIESFVTKAEKILEKQKKK